VRVFSFASSVLWRATSVIRNKWDKAYQSCASTTAPGYRVYFTKRGQLIVILLVGGDKSGQKADIKTAIQLAKNL